MGEASNKIRHDIEDTRGKMAETLDAIGYKVNLPARARDRSSRMGQNFKSRFTRTTKGMKDKTQQLSLGEQVSSGLDLATNVMKDAELPKRRAKAVGSFAKNNATYMILGAIVVAALGGILMRSERHRLAS